MRFLQQHADALVDLAGAPLPVLEMLAGTEVTYLSAPAPRAGFGRYTQMVDALGLRRAIVDQPVSGADLRAFALRHLHSVAADTLAHLGPPQRMALWAEPRWLGCPCPGLPRPCAPALPFIAPSRSATPAACCDRRAPCWRRRPRGIRNGRASC